MGYKENKWYGLKSSMNNFEKVYGVLDQLQSKGKIAIGSDWHFNYDYVVEIEILSDYQIDSIKKIFNLLDITVFVTDF